MPAACSQLDPPGPTVLNFLPFSAFLPLSHPRWNFGIFEKYPYFGKEMCEDGSNTTSLRWQRPFLPLLRVHVCRRSAEVNILMPSMRACCPCYLAAWSKCLHQSDLLHGALQLEREEASLHAGDNLWHDPVQRGNNQDGFPLSANEMSEDMQVSRSSDLF